MAVRPEYTTGVLVRVAGGRNQAEAELIQGLLLEEGIPSILKRTAGFDVPDFMAAGPRDVFVPASGADVAHEVLLQSELSGGPLPEPDAGRILRWMLGGLVALALVAAAIAEFL